MPKRRKQKDLRNVHFAVMLTAREREAIHEHAGSLGFTDSTWARRKLLAVIEATKISNKHHENTED